ncbi:MAG: hypothetical protein K2X77_18305 [Candidatus Obscuribacterales bacterium]|jgi:hypothetical protein|nr:hypothetical protein [Candidatus Obscuribacterales bacterium]
MATRFRLQLYVRSSNSGAALAQLYRALEHHPYTDYELAIVNIDRPSEISSSEIVRITPTLWSLLPDGRTIVLEGLDDISQIRKTFGFREKS